MKLHCKSYPNLYKDSVSLMQVSAKLNAFEGVSQASVAMATDANIERMRDAGMNVELAARPNDLLIALMADDETGVAALEMADTLLRPENSREGQQSLGRREPTSISMGVEDQPDATLALISVPGRYAGAEAMKALQNGLNVMLFSDNVPEEEERAIKAYATERGLLVMGPDCGTAIVNQLPLGFANVIRPGAIGLVAASGTGLQEVSCAIHHLGEGVSQALGTGGRDLHEEIGGLSMIQAIRMLADDPDTQLITLISKPPRTCGRRDGAASRRRLRQTGGGAFPRSRQPGDHPLWRNRGQQPATRRHRFRGAITGPDAARAGKLIVSATGSPAPRSRENGRRAARYPWRVRRGNLLLRSAAGADCRRDVL